MYTIGQFSKRTGLPASTLRYYEDLGLIAPQRDAHGHRQYAESELSWITFIIRLKDTGMPLSQIRHYSDLRAKGDSSLPERLAILEEHRQRLQAEKIRLEEHLDRLDEKIAMYRQKS